MSVCAKALLLWEIQPKQTWEEPRSPAGRTGCRVPVTHSTTGTKDSYEIRKSGSSNHSLVICEETLLVLTAGRGTSREAVHVLPKSPEKEINPTSPCALSLGRGSVAGWDPLWRLPRLPLLLNKCLSVCPASVRAAGCVWGQHSCLGPAQAAQPCPAHTHSFGLQNSLPGYWS